MLESLTLADLMDPDWLAAHGGIDARGSAPRPPTAPTRAPRRTGPGGAGYAARKTAVAAS